MTEQEKIFVLMAHAEEVQAHADKLQAAAQQVVTAIPSQVRTGISTAVTELLEAETRQVRESLSEATTAISQQSAELRSLQRWPLVTMLIAIFVFAAVLMLLGWYWLDHGRTLITAQREELEQLQGQIADARASLAELQQRGAGVSVVTSEGKTWIALPKGARFGETADTNDGRKAVFIILRGRK